MNSPTGNERSAELFEALSVTRRDLDRVLAGIEATQFALERIDLTMTYCISIPNQSLLAAEAAAANEWEAYKANNRWVGA